MAVMTRPMSSGARPASSSAARAATIPRSDELRPGSATRRSLIPVRCVIHASEVSSTALRSSLVTTFPGA